MSLVREVGLERGLLDRDFDSVTRVQSVRLLRKGCQGLSRVVPVYETKDCIVIVIITDTTNQNTKLNRSDTRGQ